MIKTTPEKWIGQTRMMRCGMKATVIAYRNHITIQNFYNDSIAKTPRPTENDYIGKYIQDNFNIIRVKH